jgi:hypothetical protein
MSILRASGCIMNFRKLISEKPPSSLVKAYNTMSARGTSTKNERKRAYGIDQFLLRPKNMNTFLTELIWV